MLAAVLAVPASAVADTPQDFSAADQYVETLPTTTGPSATGNNRRGKTPLRPSVAAKLRAQGGADAASLEALATSSDFGAPQGKAHGADRGNDSQDQRDSRNRTAVPSASVQAVQGNAEDLLWLLLALVAITGLMVGAVFYQRHRNRDST